MKDFTLGGLMPHVTNWQSFVAEAKSLGIETGHQTFEALAEKMQEKLLPASNVPSPSVDTDVAPVVPASNSVVVEIPTPQLHRILVTLGSGYKDTHGKWHNPCIFMANHGAFSGRYICTQSKLFAVIGDVMQVPKDDEGNTYIGRCINYLIKNGYFVVSVAPDGGKMFLATTKMKDWMW